MKQTGNMNINTRSYWNGIYGGVVQRAQYKTQGTNAPVKVGEGQYACGAFTNRFVYVLKEMKDGDKLLDIGCGVGSLTHYAKVKFPKSEIWGVDISDQVIADNLEEDPDINYLPGSVGHLEKIPDGYFDIVFAGELLEHLDDPNELMKDAYKKLKIGGKLIITTPNEEHITSPEHTWIFEKKDIDKLFWDNGFTGVEFQKLPDIEHTMVIWAKGTK